MNEESQECKTCNVCDKTNCTELGVIPTKHRWMLQTKTLPYLAQKSVVIDYTHRIISLECYEIIDTTQDPPRCPTQDWAETDVSEEVMVFTTTDGSGNPLYEINFSGLEIIKDRASFDYDDANPSFRSFAVAYKKCERKILCRSK